MKTSKEFLQEVKTRHHLPSDGQLAKILGHTRSSISLLMQGKNYLGDDTAMKVAELLNLDPAYVVACIHAERAKHEGERKLWERIAALASGVTVAALLFAAPLFADNYAAIAAESSNSVYYVKLLFGFSLLFLALSLLKILRLPP